MAERAKKLNPARRSVNLALDARKAESVGMKKRTCRTCAVPITRHSRTGLCRSCSQFDPEVKARRQAAQLLREATDHDLRERRRQHMARINRTPEARERSRIAMTRASHLTPEARVRGGQVKSARMLAHIPPAYRDLYRSLTRKGLPAAEASEAVEQQYRVDRRRAG